MKRQLAWMLAACMSMQLPLGGFNAYGAQQTEYAVQREASEEEGEEKDPSSSMESGEEEEPQKETEGSHGSEDDKHGDTETGSEPEADKEVDTETGSGSETDKEGDTETGSGPEADKESDIGSAPEAEGEKIPTATPSEPQKEDGEAEDSFTEILPAATPSQLAKPRKEHRGAVTVEIRTLLPVKSAVDFQVQLEKAVSKKVRASSDEERLEDSQAVSLMPEEDAAQREKAVFDNLPDGKYDLRVTAEGYLPYEQPIEVKGDTSKVMILNDYGDTSYSSSSAHPGLIRMGDVNGSGSIDKEDLDELIDAVYDGEVTGKDQEGMDLNRDGEVDLIDLQYFASLYTGKEGSDNIPSTVERSITVHEGDVKLASSSNATRVEGDVEDLFNTDSNSSIMLEREDEDQPISEEFPVQLELELSNQPVIGGIVIQSPVNSEGAISTGEVEAELEDGKILHVAIERYARAKKRGSFRSSATATVDADGAILIDLKNQKPVKKIRIKITGTVSEGNLAEISQVEFLGDMKDRIPPPAQNIPQNVSAQIGSEMFTLTWDRELNITGYEVSVTHEGKTELMESTENTLTVQEFDGKELLNYETYLVKVRAVNGSWKSGYSQQISVMPEPEGPPPAPENISIEGGYKSLHVSWKKMKDTKSYSLYFRQTGMEDFTVLEELTGTSTSINGLEDRTEYEIYMVGHNPWGESPKSNLYSGSTIAVEAAKMPAYRLINTAPEEGEAMAKHIKEVTIHKDSSVTSVPGDVVDGDPYSCWELKDWDSGGTYEKYRGPIITLDQPYTMDTIAFISGPNQKTGFLETNFRIRAWEGEESEPVLIKGRLSARASLDQNGKTYYEFLADEPFTADQVQINLTTVNSVRYMSIAEIRFYEYDLLLNEVLALYTDDLHMTLREDVDEPIIASLRAQADQVDPASGEMTPKRDLILKELDNAEQILKHGSDQRVISVNTAVSKKYDSHITFSAGLNGWQPLGTAALAGEQVVIYVGSPGKRSGDNTNLTLYATQYHGEASHLKSNGIPLKIGFNEITIPTVSNMKVEKGGALYVEYTGNKPEEIYKLRVSGGSQYPVLDVTQADTEEGRRELVDAYVEEMADYVEKIESLHYADPDREDSHSALSGQEYDEKNCILGATDIVLDQVMYSIPIQRVYDSVTGGGASREEASEKLYQSLKAMDEMVYLFYQHKGLNADPVIGTVSYPKDRLPSTRLNIRYQRMFAGAFMYAGGLHIGIEWDSCGLAGGAVPIESEDGIYASGNYFGWGIAHEIGHIINESAYAVAEVTNNYYSILAQAKDTNDSVRFKYEDAYRKVTSGTKGGSSDQLGMYWQLHLAYDDGFNFKTYENYEEQRENLIFARIDSYARDVSRAPAPGNVELTLNGADKDNKLMRLACAAAEKNVLEFFTRWGMTPDGTTKNYADQFPKEERAIYYINDEARKHRVKDGSSIADSVEITAAVQQSSEDGSRVTLTMEANGKDGSDLGKGLFGYEITRLERRYGKTESKVVGFTLEDTFTDVVAGINNRVVGYEIRGIDWCMNPTKPYRLTEEILVSHDGSMDKAGWSIAVNTWSEEDWPVDEDGDSGESQYHQSCSGTISSAKTMIDEDPNTIYIGIVPKSENTGGGQSGSGTSDAQAVISLGRTEAIAGIKYTYRGEDPVAAYTISISDNGEAWTTIKSGVFQLTDGTATVHFDKENDGRYYVYEAAYVKITADESNRFAAAELDVLNPVGDQIMLDETGIGILKEDAVLKHDESGHDAEEGEDTETATPSNAADIRETVSDAGNSDVTIIPKGSIVFTGSYKGNPAYNMVLLFDENGNVVGGKDSDGDTIADQLIFAPDPKEGQLGEITEGRWIYYILPEYQNGMTLPGRVRAELYRTQDANTNEQDRLVSDTKLFVVPSPLPEMFIPATIK